MNQQIKDFAKTNSKQVEIFSDLSWVVNLVISVKKTTTGNLIS